MAKTKESVTALVPVEEQPYDVPGNWRWYYVGNVCSFIGGGTPDKAMSAYWNGNIPWASVKDIKGDHLTSTIDTITEEGLNNSAANVCKPGNLIMITRIEPGKTIIADIATAINQDLKIVKSNIAPQFLHYYFVSIRHEFDLRSSGSTVKGITIPNIQSLHIPLPPLPEQRRIVERIESLFAKLDEAKEKAQAVVDGFEDRKAAILHKAFTGELTEEWRREHTISIDSWLMGQFGDIIVEVKNGTTVKQSKEKNKYPVTRIESLQKGTIDQNRLGYIVDPNTISPSDYYFTGDIAFSHINSAAHVGKMAVIEEHHLPLIHGMNLLRIRLNEKCIPEFLFRYSQSAEYKDEILQRINMAVNQVSMNQKQLKSMPIKLPSIPEQREIVRILDTLLSKEQQAKEAAEAVLSQIDSMKKSILAKAFRGELGTNDPSEALVEI